MKKSFILVLLSLIIFLSACTNNVAVRNGKVNEPEKIKVKVMKIEPQIFVSVIKLVSDTMANQDLDLSSQVGGIIEFAPYEVGDYVTKGQVILKVDSRMAEKRYLQAKYAYDVLKATFQRQTLLFKDNMIATQNYETIFSQFKSSEAALAIAKLSYDNSVIKAPVSGFITARNFDVGEMCAPGIPVYNLVNLEQIKVNVSLTEADYIKIKDSQVIVNIPSINKTFNGKIFAKSSKADLKTKTFLVTIIFTNQDHLVKSGMMAEVTFFNKKYPSAIVIRYDYVIDQGPEQFVAIVKNGKAVLTPVVLGERQNKNVRIISGLNAGDLLVIEGQYLLENGQPVEAVF